MPAHTDTSTVRKPLRLWPGIAAAVLMVLIALGVPLASPDNAILGVLGAIAVAALIVLWWLFFSRAPWSERIGAIVLMAVALAAIRPFLHESITGGMMGRMPLVYIPPVLCFALVVWAAATRRLSAGPRRVALAVAILAAGGLFTVLRTGGVAGDGMSDFHWRWTPTAEERLLAQAGDDVRSSRPAPAERAATPPADPAVPTGKTDAARPVDTPAAVAAPAAEKTADPKLPLEPGKPAPAVNATSAEWPGFRGANRDATIRGLKIRSDWSTSPPKEMWRRPIGPGWSSFAVNGDLIYTQEQRGEEEIVAGYRLSTGEPVWRHRDPVRFYESNGGAGPRGTPTVHDGRVYSFGATGILNALDARTGARLWSRNAATDTDVETPGWGFASSPLVMNDVVIVAVSGRLAAYDAATGKPRWYGPTGGSGYSSPHALTIDGVPQILLLRGSRTISVSPADGRLLWEHTWQPGVGIVQPALAADGSVLITVGDAMGGVGMRRLALSRKAGQWTVEERWTTRGLKPYFNDFVVHQGHAYGFDGTILACINLADGERKWKGGRYGAGQMVLLPDQNALLVLSEEGELALVSATPEKFAELARFKAIEGKTWNHPVLAGDIVLVRNGEEMAAFRIPLAGN